MVKTQPLNDLQTLLEKQQLSDEEVLRVIKNLKSVENPYVSRPVRVDIKDPHVRFGVISDIHLGHKCYREDVAEHAARAFKREGVEFIINSGDTVEGMSGRDGHIYELTHLGATAQLDFFAEQFERFNQWKVYSVEAQNSHGGWFKSKGNAGLDIGVELARRAPNYVFLGYNDQVLSLENGLKIGLRHPGGGTAYAISYKMQKYIESISGGKKPHILVQGHFHKANYIFYRNVHGLDAGTLCDQTPFMQQVGTPAHVGYWIVDTQFDKKKGCTSFSPRFEPFYD